MSTLRIRPAGSAPFACQGSVSAAGSNWDWDGGGKTSFLIGAWYRQAEDDFDFLRLWNPTYHDGLYGSDGSLTPEDAFLEQDVWNLGAAPGSSYTLSWGLPWRQPHHIAVYAVNGASVAVDGSMQLRKVLPTTGLVNGNIPGNATSVLLLDGTSRTQKRNVPAAWSFTLAPGTSGGVYIPGNRVLSFVQSGAVVINISTKGVAGIVDGTYRVTQAQLVYTNAGEMTKLSLSGGAAGDLDGNGGRGGYIQYDLGPICPVGYTYTDYYLPPVTLSLEEGVQLSPRKMSDPAFDGEQVESSLLNYCPFDSLSFDLNMMGVTQGGLYRLSKFAAEQIPVEIRDLEDEASASTTGDVPRYLRYFGRLAAPNNPGTAQRWGDTVTWSASLSRVQRYADERGWYKLRTMASATQTFVVDGDWTSVFTAGQGFRVFGTATENKQFKASSSSYSSATDQTTIVVTGGIVATGALPGYIEVYEW